MLLHAAEKEVARLTEENQRLREALRACKLPTPEEVAEIKLNLEIALNPLANKDYYIGKVLKMLGETL